MPLTQCPGQSVPLTQDTQNLWGRAPWRMSHTLQNNEGVLDRALSQFKCFPRCEVTQWTLDSSSILSQVYILWRKSVLRWHSQGPRPRPASAEPLNGLRLWCGLGKICDPCDSDSMICVWLTPPLPHHLTPTCSFLHIFHCPLYTFSKLLLSFLRPRAF